MRTRDLILEYIKKYFDKHCYAPSFDEIADAIGISKSTLHGHMKRLMLDGEIETDFEDNFGRPRAFRPKGYRAVKEAKE